jgi:hypothetical protein
VSFLEIALSRQLYGSTEYQYFGRTICYGTGGKSDANNGVSA